MADMRIIGALLAAVALSVQPASSQSAIAKDLATVSDMVALKELGRPIDAAHVEMFCAPAVHVITEIAEKTFDAADLLGVPSDFRRVVMGCRKLEHGPSSHIYGMAMFSGAWGVFDEADAALAFEIAGRKGNTDASVFAVMLRSDPDHDLFNEKLMLEQVAFIEKAGKPGADLRAVVRQVGDMQRRKTALCANNVQLREEISRLETQLARVGRSRPWISDAKRQIADTEQFCGGKVPPPPAKAAAASPAPAGPKARPDRIYPRKNEQAQGGGDITMYTLHEVPNGVVPKIDYAPGGKVRLLWVDIERPKSAPNELRRVEYGPRLIDAMLDETAGVSLSNDQINKLPLMPDATRVLACYYRWAGPDLYWLEGTPLPSKQILDILAPAKIGAARKECPAASPRKT